MAAGFYVINLTQECNLIRRTKPEGRDHWNGLNAGAKPTDKYRAHFDVIAVVQSGLFHLNGSLVRSTRQ